MKQNCVSINSANVAIGRKIMQKSLKSQARQLEIVKRQRKHPKITGYFSGWRKLFISGKVVRTFQEIPVSAMVMKM